MSNRLNVESRHWLAAALLLLLSVAGVQKSAAEPWNSALPKSCDEAKARSSELNYVGLINAIGLCGSQGTKADSTFFLLLSQIRFRTDNELLEPVDQTAKSKRAKIKGFLFYRAGGPGPDSIYRTEAQRAALFERLRNWSANIPAGYNPGWEFIELPSRERIVETSLRHRDNRIEKLRWYAALVSDDDYYAAKQQSDALSRRLKGRFVSGTPEFEESRRLSKKLNAIERRLQIPAPELKAPPRSTK